MTNSESSSPQPNAMSAHDVLPPVQPPAAGFIIQLFLIPLLIVSIIVGVWLTFSWLVRTHNEPEKLIDNIERVNHASWQNALSLAQLLRDPRNTELRQNQPLAERLAQLLTVQIEEGRRDKDHQWLRLYLCRALGEFEIDAGCDALALAATEERHTEDLDTRRAALQAIGVLAGRLGSPTMLKHPDIMKSVLKGTDEYAESGEEKARREVLRSTSTYVLGLLDSEQSRIRLAELLHDPSLDVDYNAAIGLARQGDTKCIPTLIEMLHPPDDALIDSAPGLEPAQQNGQKEWKRSLIVSNALKAIGKMRKDHPETDASPLQPEIQRLADDPQQPKTIRIQASEVLRLFDVPRS